jgi:hypothetical protein
LSSTAAGAYTLVELWSSRRLRDLSNNALIQSNTVTSFVVVERND